MCLLSDDTLGLLGLLRLFGVLGLLGLLGLFSPSPSSFVVVSLSWSPGAISVIRFIGFIKVMRIVLESIFNC